MIESDEQKLVVRRVFRNGRRQYDAASKARLVAECLLPGVSVSRVALDNGVNANLLRKWLKEAKGIGPEGVASPPAFIPVVMADDSLPTEKAAARGENCLASADRAGPFSTPVTVGETVTEQLHIEVKAKVLENVRFKYACRQCDRTGITTPVVTAPMAAQPLPGSIATASTLAFALVHKYVDGTPLYRLAQSFERAGVPVSRGALGHCVIGSSERHLSRLYDALKLRLRSHPDSVNSTARARSASPR